MLRSRHASSLFLAAASLLILEAATSPGCQEVFSCDGEPSNLTFSNISTSASCCPDADSCFGALKYQNSSNLQDGGGRLQNRFANTAAQGTMDILKSRRLANRKFRLASDGVHSALPSDDIFTARRGRPPVVVHDHVAANLSWANQTGADAAAWNITAVNLTAVDAGAWNISAANLTAAGLTACDISLTHLTRSESTSAHDLV